MELQKIFMTFAYRRNMYFFIFDMSIPDLIYADQLGCKNLFLRLSEYEDPSFIPARS